MSFLDTLKGHASSAWATIQTLTTPIAPSFTTPRVDLQGKRALVTGANSGIGLEVARSLASDVVAGAPHAGIPVGVCAVLAKLLAQRKPKCN